MKQHINNIWKTLQPTWKGEWHDDELHKILYATDASVYKETPLAVAIPFDSADVQQLVIACKKYQISIIPRGAGTSLAGQVVGAGIIMDCSKYMNKILELNVAEKWIRVQPGVIRDELNQYLAQHNLMFGPETSTTNRCTIGGMIGNNSCGSRSLIFGATRDHLLACEMILSDGEFYHFKELNHEEFEEKTKKKGLEGNIYKNIQSTLTPLAFRKLIEDKFPKASIKRRNHGYAIDYLAKSNVFDSNATQNINLCNVIAGSEGTLGTITEAKLNLVDVLPKHQALVCIHCNSIQQSLLANIEALKFNPTACELMDHYIIECTGNQIEQTENRFFIEGEPKAILVVEFAEKSADILQKKVSQLQSVLKTQNLAYAFPEVSGSNMNRVWDLRKAGLGLLSNIPGDAKPVAVIEDTAVDAIDLPSYISEFNAILTQQKLSAVHYAHAATGELHLRPILNLKTKEGVAKFKEIATAIAVLVKKYRGSLSGEHGDGRLRGYFIKEMYGNEIYNCFQQFKESWDPNYIFNPHKIIDVPEITEKLRYNVKSEKKDINTAFDFTETGDILGLVEMCNGSGDCIKTELTAGTMCPSYMATRKEKDSTRGRANVLREVLTHGNKQELSSAKVSDALELCLSCKACKRECPSNVDMARLKAEINYQKQVLSGFNLRNWLIAKMPEFMVFGANFPYVFNAILKLQEPFLKSYLKIAKERTLPKTATKKARHKGLIHKEATVWLFIDEFTQFENPQLIIETLELFQKLGIPLNVLPISFSGRNAISVGMLDHAKKRINRNLNQLKDLQIDAIIGIEPSALLSFKDEYADLCHENLKPIAEEIAGKTHTIESFLLKNHEKLTFSSKKDVKTEYVIHTHCYQKALCNGNDLENLLGKIGVKTAITLDSGCCGMAGFFGYQKSTYEVSKKISETKLLPKLRANPNATVIAAGTSCKHQIKDLENRLTVHPVTVLHSLIIDR